MWISGEPFVYTDWSLDQPDNNGGPPLFASEMCIQIRNLVDWVPNNVYAKWNDLACTGPTASASARAICKQEQTV